MTREEAIEMLKKDKEQRGNCFISDALDMAIEALEQNRCGTWRHYEGMLYCSKCGAEFYDDIMEYTGDEVPKHCPDCGAKIAESEDKE